MSSDLLPELIPFLRNSPDSQGKRQAPVRHMPFGHFGMEDGQIGIKVDKLAAISALAHLLRVLG
jgi:hypothetical protein